MQWRGNLAFKQLLQTDCRALLAMTAGFMVRYQNFHQAFLPAILLVAGVLPPAAVVLAAEAAAAPATLSFLVPF